MSNIIYSINRGINRPLEFRGLQGQYIWYLESGLVAVLILFSVLYIAGVNAYVSVLIGLGSGGFVFFFVYRINNKYGQHGLSQKKAQSKIPMIIKSYSRKFLIKK
ncbi:MAG: DUF4133 domain-containing protein [Bacteroidota bacterium]|nr:DUF4133 domain-containing protein [Bacteroidota bacterium]